jgi:aspartyl-tRNA(Asn)/glutamyl-tRNA(Gln) amidotransferase subunit A
VNIELTTVASIRHAILNRSASAEEVVRSALARITALEPRLHCFLQLFDTHAIEAARQIDRRMAAGENLPLAGVPIAVKDNICVGTDYYPEARTTAGSRMLENYQSPFTATAAQKLIEAGAVIIGKTNLDEFGMGSSGENSAFGPTRNPWDPTRVPGGSSSGSAAAVAAGLVPAALGSDTGGSIRQPAAFCGVLGLKPTYGRVSRYGLVAYASSLDQIGPIARNAYDAAALMQVLCGRDGYDATSADKPIPDFTAPMDTPIEGLVLGVPKQAYDKANDPAVIRALEDATQVLTSFGARTIEVDLPHLEHAIAAYYLVATAEASSNLARFDGVRYGHRAAPAPGEDLNDLYCRSRSEGLGPEVQRRIMLGTYALSSGYYDAYYLTASKLRRKLKADYDAAFKQGCHAILTPTAPTPAFRFGEKTDPLSMYLGDIYTVAANLVGLPAISIPAGFATAEGPPPTAGDRISAESHPVVDLPVGLQLTAPAWEEPRLLRIARMFETNTDHHEQRPPM